MNALTSCSRRKMTCRVSEIFSFPQEETFCNEMGTICRCSGCHVVFNGITDCASQALLYNNDADADRQMPNADGYEALARHVQIKHTHRGPWQRATVNLIHDHLWWIIWARWSWWMTGKKKDGDKEEVMVDGSPIRHRYHTSISLVHITH